MAYVEWDPTGFSCVLHFRGHVAINSFFLFLPFFLCRFWWVHLQKKMELYNYLLLFLCNFHVRRVRDRRFNMCHKKKKLKNLRSCHQSYFNMSQSSDPIQNLGNLERSSFDHLNLFYFERFLKERNEMKRQEKSLFFCLMPFRWLLCRLPFFLLLISCFPSSEMSSRRSSLCKFSVFDLGKLHSL